jgi:hypothetical protein
MKLTGAHVFDPIRGFVNRDVAFQGDTLVAQSGEEGV